MKINNAEFDVIVVGAGPVGSATAEALARASLRVALLEEHAHIGLPDHCSGLVSPRTLEVAGVAEETVGLARFNSARVWGPGGKALWLRSDSVQAIVIDRPRFDHILADRAARAGATLMLGTRACRFERLGDGIRVEARAGENILRLHAPLLIGADGANSRVARWVNQRTGTGHAYEIIPAIKADIAFEGPGTDTIEIFVGNSIAPGWFGWIIPVGDGVARVGIGATRAPQHYLKVLFNLIRYRFGDYVVRGTRAAPLPLGPGRDFVSDGVMLVGAAARQTKPTTGGGIYFGLRAARLAAATAIEAIRQGDCSCQRLAEYERAWHRLDGRELKYGRWLRMVFRGLSDRWFDLAIGLLGKPWAQGWLSCRGDMDFPSRLFIPLAPSWGKRPPPPRTTEAAQLAGQGI